MKNEKWVRASAVKKGDKIQFAKPQTVTLVGGNSNTTFIEFGQRKKLMQVPPNSFIAILQDELTATEYPHPDELHDRLTALLIKLIGSDLGCNQWVAALLASGVVDVEALVELTNDLEAPPQPERESEWLRFWDGKDPSKGIRPSSIYGKSAAMHYLKEPLISVVGGVNVRTCRVCGCTDDDCSQCIEATGGPCSWVEADLCSRCAQSPIPNPQSETK